jgi:hypothetical protein
MSTATPAKRTETPFYRLPEAERIALLVPLTGKPVRLHVTPLRGADEHATIVEGGLVAVARMPFGGTTRAVAVVWTVDSTDRVAVAVELAKIRRVQVPR